MKKLRICFLNNKRGVSTAISTVIITAVIITLVLVSSTFAYQILEQQKAMAEFEIAKQSILAFNDALENVARTGREAARSVRFTTEYGHVELLPEDHPDAKALIVTAEVDGANILLYNGSSGFLKYCIKTDYVTYWEGYTSYILGDQRPLVSTMESFGRALIEQQSSLVSITLDYRVRVMKTSVINVKEGEEEVRANTVDIWIIKVKMGERSSYIYDFDLKAKCINVETNSRLEDLSGDNCQINVELGAESDSNLISLDEVEKVVFNVIITEVLVTA